MVSLGFDEYEDFLRYFVPPDTIPQYIIDVADNIDKATVVIFKEYGAIITNSINDILKFLKKKGYSMELAEQLTDNYHTALLKFHRVEKNG